MARFLQTELGIPGTDSFRKTKLRKRLTIVEFFLRPVVGRATASPRDPTLDKKRAMPPYSAVQCGPNNAKHVTFE